MKYQPVSLSSMSRTRLLARLKRSLIDDKDLLDLARFDHHIDTINGIVEIMTTKQELISQLQETE